jgi:serine/threonine protein phosphatase 1
VLKGWFSKSATRRARTPEGTRIYAVGDIHGRADLLAPLLLRIDAHLASRPAERAIHVFLGDYIDRGPASREVVDQLLRWGRTHEVVFLKGNHEAYASDFLKNPDIIDEWRQYGGFETLLSYGLAPSLSLDPAQRRKLAVSFHRALPHSHRHFFGHLRLSFTCGDYFFVHAGIRPGIPFADQREEDLLWIRDEFLSYEKILDKIVVHGHTPVPEVEVRLNRINIDTGAYATGRLTCLLLEGEGLFSL